MLESGSVKKPVMRGLLHSQIKKNLILAGVSVVVAGCFMKFVYGNGNKNAYAEFFKTYDIEKEFERQRKTGVFDSCDSN